MLAQYRSYYMATLVTDHVYGSLEARLATDSKV